MKSKLFLLSLVALTLAFTACNKKKDEPKSEIDAIVSVAVQSAALRAYENGAGTEDMKVKKLAVMVYQGESQVAYKEVTDGSLKVEGIETTAGAKTLVVVANYATTNLRGLSLTKVKALTHELAAADQDPTQGTLLLTAEPISVTLVKGKNQYGYDVVSDVNNLSTDKVQLKHIHAGISFKSVAVDFAESYKELCNVKFDNGALIALVAKAQSNIFGASSLVNTDDKYFFGVAVPGQSGQYTPGNYSELSALKIDIAAHADIVATSLSGKGFYVLENNSTDHPTILCLKGTLTNKDGGALTAEEAKAATEAGWIVSETDHTTYYPILVNWTKDGYSYGGSHVPANGIVRNNKYEIALTITGPGTGSPEKPAAEKANLDVQCEVTPWDIVEQTVVW